jgi:hypothetical protein
VVDHYWTLMIEEDLGLVIEQSWRHQRMDDSIVLEQMDVSQDLLLDTTSANPDIHQITLQAMQVLHPNYQHETNNEMDYQNSSHSKLENRKRKEEEVMR